MLSSIAYQSRENRALQLVYVFLVAMAVLIVISVIQQGWEIALRKENGGVERASLYTAVFAAALALALMVRNARGILAVPIVLALFALRELDFHDWWFEPGLLHTAIFTSPAPLWHKLVSGAVMAFILLVLAQLVWRGTGPLLKALRERRGWPLLVVLGVALAGLSVALDGLPARMGPNLSDLGAVIASVTEETGELALFVCLLLAVAVWPTEARR
ncbi:MAG: hypothetical protein AAGA15_16555 [Pseudomonadota bacterium]